MNFRNLFGFIGVLFGLAVMGCARSNPDADTLLQKKTRFMMDTYVSIQVPGSAKVIPAIDRALDRMEALDRKFSTTNPVSPVYRFNHNNEPIRDPEIVALTEQALEISRKTQGRYDITIQPLVHLWGFDSSQKQVPSPKLLAAARQHVGFHHVDITRNQVIKTEPFLELDFGSCAKGYAVGEAVKVLKAAGIRDAIVDGGGNLAVMGNYEGRAWRVGIRHPRTDGLLGVLEASNICVVTSGDYERFFIAKGKRFHHILDATTGYPAQGLMSVTILAPDSTTADFWSTAFFIMGLREGMRLIARESQVEALAVTLDGKRHFSKGMAKLLSVEP